MEKVKSTFWGGGEMGERIRSFDWEKTSLGPVYQWSQTLITAVNIILQSPASMVILWGNEGLTLYNNGYISFAGQRHPVLLGASCEAIWPEAAGFIRNVINTCLKGESLTYKRLPYKVYRNNIPEDIWMDLDCSPIVDSGGIPQGVLIVNIEVTDQVQTEINLKKAEQHFEAAMEAAEMVGTWNWDIRTDLIFSDARYGTLFSVDPEKRKEGSMFSEYLQVIHPDDLDRVNKAIEHSLKTKEKFYQEYRVIQKDGNVKWVLDIGRCFFDDQEQPVNFSGVVMDITDRKQMENALKESQSTFSSIFNQTTVGMAQTDLEGKFILVNDRYCEIVGRSKEELYQLTLFDITLADDLEENRHLLENLLKHGTPFKLEKRYVRPDDSLVWVHIDVSTVKDKDGNPKILGVCQDISERKYSEEAIKESEQRFRTLADQSPMIIYVVEPGAEATISYFNTAWLEYTGQSFNDAIGNAWEGIVHPDDLNTVFDLYVPAFRNREAYTLPAIRLKRHDGVYRWHLFKGNPRYLPNGEFVGFIGVGIDIHDLKEAEKNLELKNEQLIRINNDLDNFIYTASHDLKSPIINIEGLVNLLNKTLDGNIKNWANIKPLFDMIKLSINKFQITIKELTEVAKVQSNANEDKKEVSFKDIFDEVKLNVQHDINSSSALITEDFSQAPNIYFSKKNLRSILYNLLSNAIKYRSPHRQTVINLKTTLADKNHILLSVKDNGLGIKEKDKSKVFTMFKRLHQHVEGTGIGLSIVKKIVDNNGGRIEIESELDKGTEFKVYLKNYPVEAKRTTA